MESNTKGGEENSQYDGKRNLRTRARQKAEKALSHLVKGQKAQERFSGKKNETDYLVVFIQ